MNQAEMPRVLERLQRIRAELRESGVPDWAGEYSWTVNYRSTSCLGSTDEI